MDWRKLVLPLTATILSASANGCGDSQPSPNGLSGLLLTQSTGESRGSVDGVDLSGGYIFEGAVCVDEAGDLSRVSTLLGTSETAIIEGNTLSITKIDDDCTVNATADIVFRSDGRYTQSNGRTEVPEGTCTIEGYSLTIGADGTTIRRPVSSSFDDGEIIDSNKGVYFVPPSGDKLLLSPDSVTEPCFMVYQRSDQG